VNDPHRDPVRPARVRQVPKISRLRPDEDFGVDERHRTHPDEQAYLRELYVEPKGPA
jgi:hypothetical protein